jgi:hypothetical protein
MQNPREAIFEALLAQLATAQLNGDPAFVTLSRKFQQWESVPDANQPAGFLLKGFEHANQRSYGETTWRLRALFWVYCLHSPDSSSIPGAMLNELLDAIEAAMLPPPGGLQTLGGLVTHAYIDGDIIVSEGSLPEDRQSIAVVPISMDTAI